MQMELFVFDPSETHFAALVRLAGKLCGGRNNSSRICAEISDVTGIEAEFYGAGCFGTALRLAGSQWVAKMFLSDRAYTNFVKCIGANEGHPAFPRLHAAAFANESKGAGVVIMEVLECLQDCEDERADTIYREWGFIASRKYECTSGQLDAYHQAADSMFEDDDEAREAAHIFIDGCNAVAAYYKAHGLEHAADFHEYNVMVRPGTCQPVIIDPWAF